MKLVKLLLSSFDSASRDRREMIVASELGYEVTVIDKAPSFNERVIDNVEVIDIPTIHRFKITAINHIATFVQRVLLLQKYEYNVLSCHDLTSLEIGWCANWFRKRKAFLVYDAHEFTIGRTQIRKKLPFYEKRVAAIEGFLVRRCAFTIVVNDSIADEMLNIHDGICRPVVVRSTPLFWKRDESAVKAARSELMGYFDTKV